jgi:hypothetical protein
MERGPNGGLTYLFRLRLDWDPYKKKKKERKILSFLCGQIRKQSETGLPDRTYIFIPKIPIWVNIGRLWNGKFWYITLPFSILYSYEEYVMAIWYIFGRLV